MKIAILSANLGSFDSPIAPVKQFLPKGVDKIDYHCYTDSDFPPIVGLTPRLQYRIPKLFGWQMYPEYDIYIWLDAIMTFKNTDDVSWLIKELGNTDCLFWKHPERKTAKEEALFIDWKLRHKSPYMTPRYRNGLHMEQLHEIEADPKYKDDSLLASTAFVYKNTKKVQEAWKLWWFYQSRYFTVDQIVLPYILFKSKLKVVTVEEDIFKADNHIHFLGKHKKNK